jgi:predicted acyl esterase
MFTIIFLVTGNGTLLTFLGPGLNNTIGNFWASSNTYPPYDTQPFELFLSSQNRLELLPFAVQSGRSPYLFDPTNPVPTIGGNTLVIACGPQDQSSLYNRSDIVSFTSDSLVNGLFICGRMELVPY